MAAALIPSFSFILKQISFYYGIPVMIMGIIGESLNIIVFLSLKIFRQSSCAFYLMIMSIFNLGRQFVNPLNNIMIWGFGIDWKITSLFYCKTSHIVTTSCTLISITCLCLAIIDQYFATCPRSRWKNWCNIKLAHRLTAIVVTIWSLHAIPYGIFYNHIISPTTNTIICQNTNDRFIQYHCYGYFFILNNLIPLITVIFGLMAYHNARTLAHQTVPFRRLELDKQLTVMVLVRVLINFFTYLPYSIQSMSVLIIKNNESMFRAKMNMASNILFYFSFLSYTTSFYTYICVSKRFRRQLKQVLFDIDFKRCRTNEIAPNQIAPEIITNK